MEKVFSYLPYIMGGFGLTVLIALMSIIGEILVGAAFTFMRRSRFRVVRGIALSFVEVFRGTAEVVQMYWVFFALPVLLAIQLPPIVAAVLVLSINGGAYASEVMRGAINSVPQVQSEACTALSFSSSTAMRRVIGPQAIAIMLPSLANVAINTTKATAVVSLITVADLAFTVQTVRTNTGQSVLSYVIALVLYLALTSTIGLLFERAERHFQHRVVRPTLKRVHA